MLVFSEQLFSQDSERSDEKATFLSNIGILLDEAVPVELHHSMFYINRPCDSECDRYQSFAELKPGNVIVRKEKNNWFLEHYLFLWIGGTLKDSWFASSVKWLLLSIDEVSMLSYQLLFCGVPNSFNRRQSLLLALCF